MGHLQGKDVRLAGLEVERLVADWDAGMRAEAPLRLHIEAGQVAIGSLAWAQVRVDGQGTGGRHEVVLDAEGTSGQVHVALAGGWRGVAAWRGRLRRADWLGSPAGDWRLESPVGVQAGQAVRIDGPLCWHSPPASLCLRIVGRPAGAMVAVGLEGLPARRLAFLWPALEERRLEGAITLEASLKQAATLTGQGRLCLGTGRFLRVRGERPAYEDFEGGCLDLRLDRQGLAIAGELRLDADNGLGLDVRLPGYHPGAPPASQAVRGTLRLAVERLERLAPWVAALDRLEGRAAGALVIAGTLGRPALALDVRIEEAVVGIPATGVDWTDVRLELSGSSGDAGIGITGRARSGEGSIAIEGRLRLTSLADWRLELRVSGSDALVAALPEARVVVSPRLRLWLRPHRVRVEGRVTVPEARLKPVKLSQPVRVSPDALVVGAEGDETGAAGWRTAARIEIVLGDDVHFEGGGLRARLGGRLTVIDRGEGVPVANGRLAIREGTFRLQGAPIAIRRGMLLYADTPLEDPGLDILLERETERALVRARIGGTLQAPVLELSSDPPLPQTETLALLLTGREASDAGPAEGRWLLEAARRLGLVGGNLLGQRLGESIGLAEARLSLGESLNEAALALGTWLSPRLYVSWTIGLFDPVAAMRIRYRLGRHLQLEINSGAEGSGGDILYTIEK